MAKTLHELHAGNACGLWLGLGFNSVFAADTTAPSIPDALTEPARSFFVCKGYSVLENEPYSGSLVPAEVYRKDPRVTSIMIEVNRRTYMDELKGSRGPQFGRIQSVITEACQLLRGYIP